MKSFLKWAGGKSRLVKKIEKTIFENTNGTRRSRLVEPFVGSGSVFMGSDFDSYLLCDLNNDLISLFNNLKYHPKDTFSEIKSLFISKNNTEDVFYELRTEFNKSPQNIRKSALFVYLNKHAFNGLCRYNKKGEFNVPFGKYKAPTLPEEQIHQFIEKSSIAEFKCIDFKKCLEECVENDVIYSDPPYVPLKDTSFENYTGQGFGLKEQKLLAEKSMVLSKKGIHSVISNHDTPVSREVYKDASKIIELEVMRNISSNGSTRGNAPELFAIFS